MAKRPDHCPSGERSRRSIFRNERMHGAQGARLAADSHTKAIDTIDSIVGDDTSRVSSKALEAICSFRPVTISRC